jgi:superfamily I DNA and RNA helicase
MDFVPTLPTFASDVTAQTVWKWFEQRLTGEDGVAFYKYPNVGGPNTPQPDLTIVTRSFHPIIIKCSDLQIDQLIEIGADSWTVANGADGEVIDSPLLETEDIAVAMQEKFDRERPLRHALKVKNILALPLMDRHEFERRFGEQHAILWDELGTVRWLQRFASPLESDQWRLVQSVVQAAVPLSRFTGGHLRKPPATFGDALKILENNIALLDMEQQRAATQIPPGPQRIRGLAGTGKTVLLALKAANIHRQFPDATILFTFNTQSLYNQAKALISKFYRHFSGVEPDFDKMHIRHAWGGKTRAGVYYEACKRQGLPALDFLSAKARDREDPFRACCAELLKTPISPVYDFILIDEAQDFPKEFFRVIFALAKGPGAKSIYFAYDELQSLSAIEIASPTEMFGSDANGEPLVSLDGEYPGPIDKDFVLHKSYRCPQEILMIAHAIGLGLYRTRGPVQMLADVNSWRSIGYDLVSGTLTTGEQVTIERPVENSPNRIGEIFPGKPLFSARRFDDRNAELDFVAQQISRNINEDGVRPEQIVVISLDSPRAKQHMSALQASLWALGIASTIPGIVDGQAEFAEPGKITLATVYRAKGNEAPVVYIISFDSLFDYVEEIRNRNRAFTSISRSKAWVTISGIGAQMAAAEKEIAEIRKRLPRFEFEFPDMGKIRKLDASETTRRKKEVKRAQSWAARLNEIDVEAIRKLDADLLKQLKSKLLEATDDAE